MADSLQSRREEMKDSAPISETGSDKRDCTQEISDGGFQNDNGYVEERFRVDRKKLEHMLQGNWEHCDEAAEDFFQRIMDETNTQISWPSKLKIGAKSKKDPHIKVIGLPDDIRVAKDLIMAVLDTKSNRATLKMDVSHTDHSHVIGKGGNNIKRVMQETGCHVHFPDSNRGNNVQEKSNQVSIAGQPQGVEAARTKIRELLPLVFMFEIPVTTIQIQLPDIQSPTMQQFQQQYNVNVSFRQRQRGFGTTVIVRGSVYNEKLVKEATLKIMELLLGKLPAPLPVSMQLEIAPQHHLFIIGRGGMNIKQIMQVTGAVIHFPDPNTVAPQRKGLVFISGTIESVYQARKQLIGCLPLVLMFDVKEELDMDPGRITQLMEHLDVFISVKPKPKQPSKSVIVKSIERNASNMYLARLLLLGIEKELPRQQANPLTEDGRQQNVLSLAALGYFGSALQPTALQINTANQLLLVNGQKSPPTQITNHQLLVNGQKSPPTQSYNRLLLANGQKSPPTSVATSQSNTLTPPSPQSPKTVKTSPSGHVVPPPPGIYGPVMVKPPASVQNMVDMINQVNINNATNQRQPPDTSQSSSFQPSPNTLHEHVGSRSQSEANSPSRSPCESPHVFRDNNNKPVDLAGLSTAPSFGGIVSHPKVSLDNSSTALDLLGIGLDKSKPSLSSSAHTMDLLGLSKTTDGALGSMGFHGNRLTNSGMQGGLSPSAHHNVHSAHGPHSPHAPHSPHTAHKAHNPHVLHSGHSSLHASLNSGMLHDAMKEERLRNSFQGSLTSGSLHASLNNGSLHGSLSNGSLHGSLNSGSLHASLNRSSLMNGDRRLDPDHLDLRAPGIERKNSQTNLFSSDCFQSFGGDYEEKKLMANKAMQKKPSGESRLPTAYWSGLMFSKSMPAQQMREFAATKGKYEPPMPITYENPADEMMEMDRDPWRDSVSKYQRPIDPAPGEYPSPRRKWPEYGLSASNHIDGALVPSKSIWSPKLDLAELFIKLGLGKYTDLFQQQEIDLPTFLTLTDQDLRELGISTFGARKKMLLAIADLNKRRMLLPTNLEDPDPFHEGASPEGSHPDIASLAGSHW